MYNNSEFIPKYLSTGSTSQVFSGKGILHAINVNKSSAVAFGIYDGTDTTTPIAVLKASISEGSYVYDVAVANGLYVTYGTNGDYTVIWTK